MVKDKSLTKIVFLLVFPMFILGSIYLIGGTETFFQIDQISQDPIVPSNPTNVVIREGAIYDAPIDEERPIVKFSGVIFWEELSGAGLNFFINTSDIISENFVNFETKAPLNILDSCVGNFGLVSNCVVALGDRYLIVPASRSIEYEIEAFYDPDIVEDTGFIVIFNSQSVDFSIEVEGEERFAKVDYSTFIVLPRNTGIVSYAPIDDGFGGLLKTSDGRWALIWEYVNRQMDSKHDPLMITVTYTYDQIFLAFTEQVFQNQQEQLKQQEEINRLNLIQQSFVIIATFAIIASLFSLFFAYLLARRKFEPDLKRAKELPRREASDIEESPSLQVPVSSLFLSALILLPMIFGPIVPVTTGQTLETDRIIWNGVYDLQRDGFLTERIGMQLPVQRENVNIYTNTSESEFKIFDEFGNRLPFDTEENRYIIPNPGFTFTYELFRPYDLYDNNGMLVWLDRFWLEFLKPPEISEPGDEFFRVDLTYSVLLPKDAIVYSASPSKLVEVRQGNRPNITFTDTNRQMDAFHDVFEVQITFSFIDIIDALENLDSNFIQIKAEKQDLESLLKVASTEVLIFSILGIIAPLISFIIAYWVFRRRYKKLIDRAEKEQEEKIFVEGPQIEALIKATSSSALNRLNEALMGHYYKVITKLSALSDRDLTILDQRYIGDVLTRKGIKYDQNLLIDLLSITNNLRDEDSVTSSQLIDYVDLVDRFLEDLSERN